MLRGLTERERAVASAARSGASAQSIADRMFLSRRTVETHLGSIYRKLGLANRAELVALLRDADFGVAVTEELPGILREAEGFVGRVEELAVVEAAVDGARGGLRANVVVTGEAGIGKSTLVARAARGALSLGVRVLASRCDPDFRAPLRPIADALRPYLYSTPADLSRLAGPSAGYLTAVLPELHSRLPDRLAADDAATARRLLVDALTRTLASATRERPTLLVIEDLQWADHATIGLLRHMLKAPDFDRFVLLATLRSTERTTPELLAEVWQDSSVRRIELTGLSVNETARFIEQTVGRQVAPEKVQRLRDRADGNPFLLGQLLREHASADQPGLPASVREVVLARARGLGPDAVRVLQAAAVLGSIVEVPVLAETLSRLHESAGDVLERLASARLLVASDGSRTYRFAHDLVRETALDALGALAGARLHQAAGHALLTVHGDDLAEHLGALVSHFTEAAPLGEGLLAARFALDAARQAASRLAPDDVLEWTGIGLRHVPVGAEHDQLRLELLLAEIDAQGTLMDGPAHRAATFRAIEVARRLGDPVLLARTVDRDVVLPTMGSVDEELLAVKRESIAALGDAPSALRSRLLSSVSYQRTIGGHGWDAADEARQAVADGRALSDLDSVVGGLTALAAASMGMPDVTGQLRIVDDLISLGDGRVDVLPERDGRRYRAILRLATGDRTGFESDLAGMTEFGERAGSAWIRSLVASWRTLLALLDGDFTSAEQRAGEVLAVSGDDPNFLIGWFAQLAHVRTFQGRAAEMAPLGQAIVAEHPDLAAVRALAADLLAATGDYDAARDLLAPLVASDWARVGNDWLRATTLAYLATAVRASFGPAECSSLAAELAPYAGQLLVAGAGSLVHGAADYFRGVLLAAGGTADRQAAPDVLAAAVALEERVRAPTLAARSRTEQAAALFTRGLPGDTTAAGELLTDAARWAQRPGLEQLARRIAELEPSSAAEQTVALTSPDASTAS